MPCRGEIARVSRIGAGEWSVEWIIRDPLSPRGRRAYYDSPDFSTGDEASWGLRLYPNWEKEPRNPASGWLRLDLDRCDAGPPKSFQVSVGIRGSTGVEKRRAIVREFSSRGYYNWVKFCSRSELIDQKSRFMPGDTLTIRCVIRSTMPVAAEDVLPPPPPPSIQVDSLIREPIDLDHRSQSSNNRGSLPQSHPQIRKDSLIREPITLAQIRQFFDQREAEFKDVKFPVDGKQYSVKQEIKFPVYEKQSSENQDAEFNEARAPVDGKKSPEKQDASTQTNAEFKEARVPVNGKERSEKQGMEKVVEDMGKLLISGSNSDVTVQVKEAEFKVHTNILSVRSEVLSAMLEREAGAEKASNRKISISDCEPDVFGEYLRYIYTGSVHFPSHQTVFDLYRVANKYSADDLKLLCLKHMRDTLCVRTFCDTVKLALAHGESDLLELCINFATRNLPLIVRSGEWQNLIRESATEANEILIRCTSP